MIKHFYENIHGWFTFSKLYKQMVDRAIDGAIFVEVGSWLGKSTAFMATEIANSNKKITFYAVDAWFSSDKILDWDKSFYSNFSNLHEVFSKFQRNIEPVKDFVHPLKMLSLEAVKLFENDSLDFVYIDACHQYDAVKADINAWFPKVKNGGIIAGHDYTPGHHGVVNAVNEFFGDNKKVFPAQETWVHYK